MKTILMHFERLRRHYAVSVRSYDQVSLLDLSHSLRIWTELKQPLAERAPDFSNASVFKTGIPARKVLRAAKGVPFIFSYMPGGVITYASNGKLISGPDFGAEDGKLTTGVSMRVSPDGYMEIGKFCVVGKSFDQPLIKALVAESVTRCNYSRWLGSEAVRLAFVDQGGTLRSQTISREMVIKRVANTLDGSHASSSGDGGSDNMFDEPIRHLLKYKMGGLPLPYFILLKIAQDILNVAPKYLDKNGSHGQA